MNTPSLLTTGEIAARLLDSPWQHADGEIVRDLEFEDFAAAVVFVNRVAELAEAHNHHPDILLHGWNKVKLSLSNHAAGGLTEIDFEMAARFDALVGAAGA